MGRKAKGTVYYVPAKPGEPLGHYAARVTLADGSRSKPYHLDPSPRSPEAEARARETAAHIAEMLRAQGVTAAHQTPAAPGETVSAYATRWFDDREARGLSSVATDRGRFRNHVEPVIGPLPIADVTRGDLRDVVEALDATTRSGAFAWRTAVKVWGLVTKMFGDACEAKAAALRVRDDNPAAGVRGPDRGERKAKQWLYPVEVSTLLACAEVPLRWRRLYALAVYLYLRPGELAALEWADVHLDHEYVNVHQALELRGGATKPTKTGITRKVPIRPELVPLLEAMRAECDGKGRVLQSEHANKEAEHGFPPIEDLAATLRRHLLRAHVDRADLHTERSTTKRITFYDLRATGITWEVLASTEHVRIMQRAGHRNFSTTQGYIREAEAVGVSVGVPFPPLPPPLAPAGNSDRNSDTARRGRRNRARFNRNRSVPNGIRRPERAGVRGILAFFDGRRSGI